MNSIPNPTDSFAKILACAMLVTAVCTIEVLLTPPALKPFLVPVVALIICAALFLPTPLISKHLSIECKARMITIFLCQSIGIECSAIATLIAKNGSATPLTIGLSFLPVPAFIALGIACIKMEPTIYMKLGDSLAKSGSENLSSDVKQLKTLASVMATQLKKKEVDSGIILLSIISRKRTPAARLLSAQGADYKVATRVFEDSRLGEQAPWKKFFEVSLCEGLPLSIEAEIVMLRAAENALSLGSSTIELEHILLGMLDSTDCLGHQLLEKLSINPENLRQSALQAVARS
jgi:hypothetical protein